MGRKACFKPCSKCGVGVRLHYGCWCKECQSAHGRRYYAENRERLKVRTNAAYHANPEYHRAVQTERDRKIKREVIDAYGGNCDCCGEHRIEFLTIDHIHGNGKAHKIANNIVGNSFYKWLRKHGYPKGEYRCLCINCNQAIGFYNYCPHQRSHPDADLSKMQRFDPEAIRRVLSSLSQRGQQRMEGEEQGPRVEPAEGALSSRPGEGIGVPQGEEGTPQDRDDQRLWRQMRLLWGD